MFDPFAYSPHKHVVSWQADQISIFFLFDCDTYEISAALSGVNLTP